MLFIIFMWAWKEGIQLGKNIEYYEDNKDGKDDMENACCEVNGLW